MKNRPDFSHASHHLAAVRQQEGKTNPNIPKIEEKERLERQWKSWGWNNWSQSFSPLQPCGRHKNAVNKYSVPQMVNLFNNERIISEIFFFASVPLTSNSDSLVSDGE